LQRQKPNFETAEHRGQCKQIAMPYATAKDATRLYYEEAGSGTPILFVHEFAADYASC
jgi:hypothetical protein